MRSSRLAACVAAALPLVVFPAGPATAAAAALSADDAVTLTSVEVRAAAGRPADAQLPPEVEDGKIALGKKTTRVELDAQPVIVDNNWRQLLARVPGLLLSEQPIPSHYNVNYRGLGDPHESEFVLVAMDGVPVMSDWFGYSTLYFTPPAQQLSHVDFLRGGSALLYGPQIGPVLNLVRRSPVAGQDVGGRLDLGAGSDGLRTGYAELQGGGARHGWLLDAYHGRSDGQRPNAGFDVANVRGAAIWQPDDTQAWELDVSGFQSDSAEPGRLTLAEYEANPEQGSTPTNRIWIDRIDVQLRHQRLVGEASQLTAKGWYAYQDRYSRRAARSPGAAPLPTSTTFDRQTFHVYGADARLLTEWGGNHTLVWGATLYASDSPRDQYRGSDLFADRGMERRFQQERDNRYAAVFVENAFRGEGWSLVPALRIDRIRMGIEETQRLASLNRAPIDREFTRTETLLGLGGTVDLGARWTAYGNVSQGYRPMRYDDIGNPTAELATTNDPDPGRATNHELGLRGSPVDGLVVDASLFRVDVEDRIEQRLVGVSDIERINSGDARHQGLEFAVDWNLLHGRTDGAALHVFLNGSLLDAEIVRSASPNLVGRTPGYAPDRILRSGLIWKHAAGHKIAVTGTHVSSHFWRDDNVGGSVGGSPLPAEIPTATVWDLAAEYAFGERGTLFGGVNNVADKVYFSRVRTDGIEVAPFRQVHIGYRWRF